MAAQNVSSTSPVLQRELIRVWFKRPMCRSAILVFGVLRPNRRNLSNRVTGNICLSNSVQRGRFWVSLRLKSCTENAVGLLAHAETVPSMFSVTQILTGGQIPPVCGYNPFSQIFPERAAVDAEHAAKVTLDLIRKQLELGYGNSLYCWQMNRQSSPSTLVQALATLACTYLLRNR